MIFALSRGKYTLETQKKVEKLAFEAVSDDYGKVVTETAGFVPLEVRFQRLVENGIQLQLKAQEFDSVDMRKLYLDDEFRVEPDDELEEIQSKLNARAEYLARLKAERSAAESKKDTKKSTNSEALASESASEGAPSVD